MGFFSKFFSGGSKEITDEQDEMLKAWRILLNLDSMQNESFSSIIKLKPQCDQIPGAKGPFGRCTTNPIPVNNAIGEITYLSKLVVAATGSRITFHRAGSVANNVDMFDIVSLDGKFYDRLYLDMYYDGKSTMIPSGYNMLDVLDGITGTNSTNFEFPRNQIELIRDFTKRKIGDPLVLKIISHMDEEALSKAIRDKTAVNLEEIQKDNTINKVSEEKHSEIQDKDNDVVEPKRVRHIRWNLWKIYVHEKCAPEDFKVGLWSDFDKCKKELVESSNEFTKIHSLRCSYNIDDIYFKDGYANLIEYWIEQEKIIRDENGNEIGTKTLNLRPCWCSILRGYKEDTDELIGIFGTKEKALTELNEINSDFQTTGYFQVGQKIVLRNLDNDLMHYLVIQKDKIIPLKKSWAKISLVPESIEESIDELLEGITCKGKYEVFIYSSEEEDYNIPQKLTSNSPEAEEFVCYLYQTLVEKGYEDFKQWVKEMDKSWIRAFTDKCDIEKPTPEDMQEVLKILKVAWAHYKMKTPPLRYNSTVELKL